MNHLKAFIFGLLLISGCNVEKKNVSLNRTKEYLPALPITQFFYEPKDTLVVQNKYGFENSVFLGKMKIDSIDYNVHTLFRKVKVADGFRGSSFLVFEKEQNEIRYELMNGDINRIVSIEQNKLVLMDEIRESCCLEEIDSFPDEMVLGCGIGFLVLQGD